MRPRVFPAEDSMGWPWLAVRCQPASMRPRVFPAEDGYAKPEDIAEPVASMRPRVFPAEDE